jgi:hypothetical protein
MPTNSQPIQITTTSFLSILPAKFGLEPGLAKVITELGGGLVVLFEFAHHLHSLDILRQSSFWAYKHYKEEGKGVFGHPEEGIRQHVNYCTDILRQQPMCRPDTSVFGQHWINSTNELFVDLIKSIHVRTFGSWKLRLWPTRWIRRSSGFWRWSRGRGILS